MRDACQRARDLDDLDELHALLRLLLRLSRAGIAGNFLKRIDLLVRSRLEIVLELGLDDSDLRSVNDLHAGALVDDARCARGLQQGIIDKLRLLDRDTKSRRARIDIGDIGLAAESAVDLRAERILRTRRKRRRCRAVTVLLRVVIRL